MPQPDELLYPLIQQPLASNPDARDIEIAIIELQRSVRIIQAALDDLNQRLSLLEP
jgi:hypothetical protein